MCVCVYASPSHGAYMLGVHCRKKLRNHRTRVITQAISVQGGGGGGGTRVVLACSARWGEEVEWEGALSRAYVYSQFERICFT